MSRTGKVCAISVSHSVKKAAFVALSCALKVDGTLSGDSAHGVKLAHVFVVDLFEPQRAVPAHASVAPLALIMIAVDKCERAVAVLEAVAKFANVNVAIRMPELASAVHGEIAQLTLVFAAIGEADGRRRELVVVGIKVKVAVNVQQCVVVFRQQLAAHVDLVEVGRILFVY